MGEMDSRRDVAVGCDKSRDEFVEVPEGGGTTGAAWADFGPDSIYPRGKGRGGNPARLCDMTKVEEFPGFQSVTKWGSIMESCA